MFCRCDKGASPISTVFSVNSNHMTIITAVRTNIWTDLRNSPPIDRPMAVDGHRANHTHVTLRPEDHRHRSATTYGNASEDTSPERARNMRERHADNSRRMVEIIIREVGPWGKNDHEKKGKDGATWNGSIAVWSTIKANRAGRSKRSNERLLSVFGWNWKLEAAHGAGLPACSSIHW